MAGLILREETDGLLRGQPCLWATEWYCRPPPRDVPYRVLREEWADDEAGVVRRIFETCYTPLKVVMHGG